MQKGVIIEERHIRLINHVYFLCIQPSTFYLSVLGGVVVNLLMMVMFRSPPSYVPYVDAHSICW